MPEGLSPIHEESFEPYRLSREQVDALRMEVQDISPEMQETYFELEKKVCKAFVEIYRESLSSEQIDYMLTSSVVVSKPEAVEAFGQWDNGCSQDFETAEMDGKVYVNYEIGQRTNEGPPEEADQADIGFQLWNGRVAVVPPLNGLEKEKINPKWLMSDKFFEELSSTRFDDLATHYATNIWAAMALHEKIHGIQDHDLPLPILETSAIGYEQVVFAQNDWQVRNVPEWNNATLVWEALGQHYGDDLPLFVFGNLKDEARKKEILKDIKKELSPEQNPHLFDGIEWKTEEPELNE